MLPLLPLCCVFIINGSSTLWNPFYISLDVIMWFIVFAFVYVIYYVNAFANIVPSLHLWGESHLIMVYELFNILLDVMFQYFVEKFSIYVHQRNWREVFFLCFVFIWFSDYDDVGFIKRVLESPILKFLKISVEDRG